MDDEHFFAHFLKDPDWHGSAFVQRYAQTIASAMHYNGASQLPHAKDLEQDVYFGLFSNNADRLRKWNPELAGFSTYLFTVATRLIIDAQRSPRYRNVPGRTSLDDRICDVIPLISSEPSPRRHAHKSDQVTQLHEALAQLLRTKQIDQRQYHFAKQRMLGTSDTKIAQMFGTTLDTVRSAQHRTRLRLRRVLDPSILEDIS